ncbi:glycosyltransferase family 50 protein [Russula earlei]|uniref:Glycosyltransferase family 50 protein n=1 Tax=Russula earlei TaxID=71964 RepID=A0ACC0UE67_9AGAM|nr:glycosyltransferase family 50 protein [Russula earlei]
MGHVIKSKLVVSIITSIRAVLVFATFIRVVLILYSEWHDAHSLVKYTDVDYLVFTDATSFTLTPGPLNHAQGPLGRWFNIGDPYRRETYRYTPLLAILLAPNKWLHKSFGKYLFAGCDILAGMLMHELLVSTVLPHSHSHSHRRPRPRPRAPDASHAPPSPSKKRDDVGPPHTRPDSDDDGEDLSPAPISEHDSDGEDDDNDTRRRATLLVALHLLNPIVIGVSTRGSSESVLSFLVLLTLFCALRGRWDWTAVFLGLCTHWKIYPVIYGVSCVVVIGMERRHDRKKTEARGALPKMVRYIDDLINAKTVRFAAISAGTFFVLGVLMYLVWGYPFVHETYLYHLHRLDHRHNFSPYFYQIYLTHPNISTSAAAQPSVWREFIRSPLTSFLTQLCLSLISGLFFIRTRQDMIMGWFVQTATFVIFNKVCTSQYFLWYMLFLPLIVPHLSLSLSSFVKYFVCWMGTQVLWLSQAYRVEFLGEPIFFRLWVCSIIYVIGHSWVLAGIAGSYRL